MRRIRIFTVVSLTFIFFGVNNSLSQGVYPPVINNSDWNVLTGMITPYYYSINYTNDTIIASVTYQNFTDYMDPSLLFQYTLREDILNKKVYRLVNNVDVLLFDFDIHLGDNILLSNGINYQVTTEDSVNVINNQKRRRLILNPSPAIPFVFSEVWIEGVGSPNHPLENNFERPLDPGFLLTCSFQNGINIYNYGLANGGSAITCPSNTITNTNSFNSSDQISISPNPFSNMSILRSQFYLKNANLILSNVMGHIIAEIKHIDGKEVVIYQNNLSSGIYFITLSQGNLRLLNQKIIIQ